MPTIRQPNPRLSGYLPIVHIHPDYLHISIHHTAQILQDNLQCRDLINNLMALTNDLWTQEAYMKSIRKAGATRLDTKTLSKTIKDLQIAINIAKAQLQSALGSKEDSL